MAGIRLKQPSVTALLQPANQGFIQLVRINRLGDMVVHAGIKADLAILVEGLFMSELWLSRRSFECLQDKRRSVFPAIGSRTKNVIIPRFELTGRTLP